MKPIDSSRCESRGGQQEQLGSNSCAHYSDHGCTDNNVFTWLAFGGPCGALIKLVGTDTARRPREPQPHQKGVRSREPRRALHSLNDWFMLVDKDPKIPVSNIEMSIQSYHVDLRHRNRPRKTIGVTASWRLQGASLHLVASDKQESRAVRKECKSQPF